VISDRIQQQYKLLLVTGNELWDQRHQLCDLTQAAFFVTQVIYFVRRVEPFHHHCFASVLAGVHDSRPADSKKLIHDDWVSIDDDVLR